MQKDQLHHKGYLGIKKIHFSPMPGDSWTVKDTIYIKKLARILWGRPLMGKLPAVPRSLWERRVWRCCRGDASCSCRLFCSSTTTSDSWRRSAGNESTSRPRKCLEIDISILGLFQQASLIIKEASLNSTRESSSKMFNGPTLDFHFKLRSTLFYNS